MSVALRPLSLGELLDQTFQLYRRHFLLFVGIAAVPGLLVLLFQVLQSVIRTSLGAGLGAIGITVLLSVLSLVVQLAAMAASQGATVWAVSELHLNRPASLHSAFAGVRGRIGRLVHVILSVGIRVLLGLILIVPGILWALDYSLAIPAALLEDLKAGAALKRSAVLTRGDRGRIFLLYVLFFVLELIFITVLGAFLGVSILSHGGATPGTGTLVAMMLGGWLVESLTGPVLTIGISLLYYDERVRKEAFDLQLMMDALEGGAPAVAPAAGL